MTEYTEKELQAWRKEYAPTATDSQFDLWMAECQSRGLRPVRDVLLQFRSSRERDDATGGYVYVKKMVFITTIGAFLKTAERTGKYAGLAPTKWIYLDADGKPSIESDVPLPDTDSTRQPRQPWAARNAVYKTGFQAPLEVVTRFWSVAQTGKDGNLSNMWAQRGPEQLEKCGIVAALRRGFPDEFSSLYLTEEIRDERAEEAPAAEPKPVAVPMPQKTPPVNQAPAVSQTGKPVVQENRSETEQPPTPKEGQATPERVQPSMEEFIDSCDPSLGPPELPVTQTSAGPAVEPKPEAAPLESPAEFPTKEERKPYLARLKNFSRVVLPKVGIADPGAALKAYLKRTAGIEDVMNMTKTQWETFLNSLDTLQKEGKLKEVLEGER